MFGFVVGLRGKCDESGGEKKEARRLFPKILPGKGLGKFREHVTTQGQISGRSLMWGSHPGRLHGNDLSPP